MRRMSKSSHDSYVNNSSHTTSVENGWRGDSNKILDREHEVVRYASPRFFCGGVRSSCQVCIILPTVSRFCWYNKLGLWVMYICSLYSLWHICVQAPYGSLFTLVSMASPPWYYNVWSHTVLPSSAFLHLKKFGWLPTQNSLIFYNCTFSPPIFIVLLMHIRVRFLLRILLIPTSFYHIHAMTQNRAMTKTSTYPTAVS